MSSAPYPASPGGGRAPRALASFADRVADWGEVVIDGVTTLGELAVFSWGTVVWLFTRGVRRETLMPNFYQVTVLSLPVIALTGTFIGMVLAVQSAIEFRQLGLQTRLGAVITLALVRELGPVLAATMLAGRVGSRMAAELGTMRVTEQIDALSCMGTNPIHYLVVPRFVACLFGIPLLTIIADFMGIVGAYMYCIFVEHIDKHHYWFNAIQFVNNWDLFVGVAKSLFFGAAIAMVSCHRGFNCGAGAEGVGRAATASFVLSFVMILLLDLFLNIFLDKIYFSLWPGTARGL